MFESKIAIISAIGGLLIAVQSPAQITNGYPLTVLETLENTTGQLVVKGSGSMGYVSLGSATATVVCKEDTVPATGKKFYGILIDLKSGDTDDATVVDDDEIDALLQSVDYVSKADGSVTSLPSFSAGYMTKAGLRIAAFTSQRAAAIKFVLHGSHYAKGIPLTPDQLSKFYDLLAQAKGQIEQLRKAASVKRDT